MQLWIYSNVAARLHVQTLSALLKASVYCGTEQFLKPLAGLSKLLAAVTTAKLVTLLWSSQMTFMYHLATWHFGGLNENIS